jgi:hypothetical protein
VSNALKRDIPALSTPTEAGASAPWAGDKLSRNVSAEQSRHLKLRDRRSLPNTHLMEIVFVMRKIFIADYS